MIRLIYTGFLALDSPTLTPLEQGGHHRGDLFSAFKETREGQCVLLALAAYQVILMQSNQYAIMGYLGTACPEP